MKAIVIHAYGDFRYEWVEKPKTGPREVVVKIGATGNGGEKGEDERGGYQSYLDFVNDPCCLVQELRQVIE